MLLIEKDLLTHNATNSPCRLTHSHWRLLTVHLPFVTSQTIKLPTDYHKTVVGAGVYACVEKNAP